MPYITGGDVGGDQIGSLGGRGARTRIWEVLDITGGDVGGDQIGTLGGRDLGLGFGRSWVRVPGACGRRWPFVHGPCARPDPGFPVEVRGPVFQVTAKGTIGAHERGTFGSRPLPGHGATLLPCAGRHAATRAPSQDRLESPFRGHSSRNSNLGIEPSRALIGL